MRSAQKMKLFLAVGVGALLSIGVPATSAQQQVGPASSDRSAVEDERLGAEEQDMLARARSEAESRRREQQSYRGAAEGTEAGSARAADQREIDRRLAADRKRAADIADARRRAENEFSGQVRPGESGPYDDAAPDHHAKTEQSERLRAEETVRIERERAEHKAKQAALSAEREAEGRRIADLLRRAESARTERQQLRQNATTEARTAANLPYAPAVATASPAVGGATRVTVLLLMEPGTRGIRRNKPTADPVLCGPAGCWISGGAHESARLLQQRKALGFFRTWGGERAGACSNSLGCVFRNVELGSVPSWLQPVDMRLVRHDRREPQGIQSTARCGLETGRLQCSGSHAGANYVMWIVPESVADAAGPALLEQALEDGLPQPRHTSLAPYLQR